MAKVNAIIESVKLRNVNGVDKILVTMSNDDQQWLPITYINKLLKSLFLEGARPTVLVGSQVEYTRTTYKAGDAVKNKGVVVPNVAPHTKDGYYIDDFDVTEVGTKADAFGTMVDNITIKAKLKGRLSTLVAPKLSVTPTGVIEAAAPVVEDAEVEQEVA